MLKPKTMQFTNDQCMAIALVFQREMTAIRSKRGSLDDGEVGAALMLAKLAGEFIKLFSDGNPSFDVRGFKDVLTYDHHDV